MAVKIDENTNTVLTYIIGGCIISLGISLTLWISGKFLNLSALFHSLFKTDSDFSWKGAALSGFLFVSTLIWNIYGFGTVKNSKVVAFEDPKTFLTGPGIYGFAFSGFLVGLGTKLAGGGLTGHAFGGLPRFSVKSMIAVGTFLGVGFLIATVKKQASFLTTAALDTVDIQVNPKVTANVVLVASIVILVLSLIKTNRSIFQILVTFAASGILAFGLLVSGFAHRTQVINFLSFKDFFQNPILYSLAAAIVLNIILFTFCMKGKGTAPNGSLVSIILGSATFGLGLGISGLTPGTALLVAPVYFPEVLLFFLMPAVGGAWVAGIVEKLLQTLKLSNAAADAYDNMQ